MLQGRFTLDDFLEQIETIQKMGPLQDIFEKLPFFSESVPEGFQFDDRELIKTKAIVSSMTKIERRDVELFRKQPTRIKRIAKGSGRTDKEVVDLLQRFIFMRQMMGDIGQQAGMLQRIPGMKQMAMAKRLKDVVKTGGLEHNPMMASLADSLLEAAVVGDPKARAAAGAGRKPIDKNRKKQKRKEQKKARRKSRR
jgi:signal recognition particle subunit SRP54